MVAGDFSLTNRRLPLSLSIHLIIPTHRRASSSAAMTEDIPYPPIEPTTFDLIIVGTGLPASVIAAAASAAGKSVIHLDSNSFYGSHFSSLPLDDLITFLTSQSTAATATAASTTTSTNRDDYIAVDISTCPMYSELEFCSHSSEPLEHSRKFNLDLAGPRVLFCADSSIDLILKSETVPYIEIKSVDVSFVCDADGKLSPVPDSRQAIFRDRTLGLSEKIDLMNVVKLVQEHLSSIGDESSENARISEEDLQSPFVEFLTKMRLPPKIKSIVLYAIAMADYDQDNMEVCKDVLKTKDGIDRLALYYSSVGRFPNAPGAFIYPIYGQGELPQGFCRRAAVKGCLYVLRMPMIALLIDKSSGHYKGVRLATGQDLFSNQLVLDPSFIVPLPLASSPPDFLQESSQDFRMKDVKGKVARGICITSCSLKPDVSNFLVVYPPRSLYPEQETSVRVLQIGSNLAVCPSGMFVLYISALCDNGNQGKKLLHAAMNAIFTPDMSGNPENSSLVQTENTEVKSTLLWSALYIQEVTMEGSFGPISFTPMPDGNLNHAGVLDATMKLFHEIYPNAEYFPKTTSSENSEDDDGLSLES